MSLTLPVADQSDASFRPLSPGLEELHRRSKDTRRASKAEGTLRAYASALRSFEAWCKLHGMTALPAEPETVVLFIESEMKLAAIRFMHLKTGHVSPTACQQ